MQGEWRQKEKWKLKTYLLFKLRIMAKLKLTQIRSIIDRPKNQKLTIEALGLGRPNWEKVHNDTPQIRGMIEKVKPLLKVEEIKEK
jgi:large subunit ribosomal protein L30